LAFLRWNKEPARIFLGDYGAIPLGFLFAAMPYYSTHPPTSQSVLLLALLFGLFFFDTGFTLIRRMLRKEPIWEAHRSHLYQRLVLAGFRHTRVTLMLILGSTCLIGITLISHFFALTLWLPVLASLCFGTVYWQYALSHEKSYYQ
jgi:UDP-N-acetylmuramyl pentapeptide phosphotransferase/UDP-N-acetylglucosamine-1-phosphate transferase